MIQSLKKTVRTAGGCVPFVLYLHLHYGDPTFPGPFPSLDAVCFVSNWNIDILISISMSKAIEAYSMVYREHGSDK